jgi:prepilin-type processing-associated H-X9-DG protein
VEKAFAAASPEAGEGARGERDGAGAGAVTLALVPTDDMRRVVEEMLPSLPPQIGGGPSTLLTRGSTWAVLTLDLPPKGSLRAVFQSKDAAAAQALSELIGRATKALSALPQLRQRAGADALTRAAGSIRPTVQGDRVTLAIDQKGLDAIAPPLAAAMGAARQRAANQVALSNVRQLLQGCMLYANEHKNTFPDRLDDAVKAAGLDQNTGAALLQNPRRPAAQNAGAGPAYEYLKRPQGTFGDTSDKVMIYEKFDQWPTDGVVVGFADGHVELVNDEALFRKLLDKTRAEAAPK